jgi:hypothetical protein
LVGVDKAQAAVLTYEIRGYNSYSSPTSYFKVDNSSLTGIGEEQIPVSEGRFYGFTLPGGREYYDLTKPTEDRPGASAIFYQGEFTGLEAGGSDGLTVYLTDPSDPEGGPSDNFFINYVASWYITRMPSLNTWVPLISGYTAAYYYPYLDVDRRILYEEEFSYTLVNTEPSPVPEPLTAGGTALALAGLSWLKHKKKRAA